MKNLQTTQDVTFEVHYGAKALKLRNVKCFSLQDAASDFFYKQQKNYHVDVFRVETTKVVKREKLT